MGESAAALPHEPSEVFLRLASESIQGRRPYQEDSLLTETLADGRVLVAVADGMGGHAAGEVASALAIQTLHDAVASGKALDEACRLANERVYAKALSEPGKKGMGTTLVSMLVDRGQFTVANVGDSRAYLVSADGVSQITEDHSFVAEAVRRGQSEEEARRSPWKDALTRSVGTDANVQVDVFGPFPVQSDIAVLLCSDGFYKTVGAGELRRVFAASTDPQDAAKALVAAAYDAGSDDNITVVVAESGVVPRDDAPAPARGGATTQRMEPIEGPVGPARAPSDGGPASVEDPADGGSGWKVAVGFVLAAAGLAAAVFGFLRR